MEKIVKKFISELSSQLKEKKVLLSLSASAADMLAKKGYDSKYGARPLSRLIQTEIKDVLSDEILFGRLEKGGRVFIGLKNGELKFNFKN